MRKPDKLHPDFPSPITYYLDSHIPLEDLRAFTHAQAGVWSNEASPRARFGNQHAGVLLSYDCDLKALHLWMLGTDGEQSMLLHYKLLEQLFESFPLAFESKAVIQFDEVYAVLGDGGCRCELESLASLITRMLEDYPGYLPERLNVVAEQAAEKFGGQVVRLARRDSFNPYVIY